MGRYPNPGELSSTSKTGAVKVLLEGWVEQSRDDGERLDILHAELAGGSQGQFLTKASDDPYDFQWVDPNISQLPMLPRPGVTSAPTVATVGNAVTFMLDGISEQASGITWSIDGNPEVVSGALTGSLTSSITVKWSATGTYQIRARVDGDGATYNNSVYTTVATTEVREALPGNDQYTVFLLHGNEPAGSKIMQDVSRMGRGGTQHPIVNIGQGVVHTADNSFFASTSLMFAGHYLQAPAHQDWVFDGDFSIDMWFKAASLGNYTPLFSTYTTNAPGGLVCYLAHSSSGGMLVIYYKIAGVVYTLNTTATIQANQKYHLEISRHGSVLYAFLNGALVGSVTGASGVMAGDTLLLGKDFVESANVFSGYLGEIRVTKGAARHAESFTPESESYGPDYQTLGNDNHTILLIKSEGAQNGSTIFTDVSKAGNAGARHNVVPIGSVLHSTARPIFGDSAIKFNSGGYLSVPASDGDMSNQSWCLETIFVPDFEVANQSISIFCSDDLSILLGYGHGAYPGRLFANFAGSVTTSAPVTLVQGQEHAIAYSYEPGSGKIRFFFQGQLVGEGAVSPGALNIGTFRLGYASFIGYVDNLRISKGHPRYLGDYRPATVPFGPNF